jgi:uncharacterized protein YkwD
MRAWYRASANRYGAAFSDDTEIIWSGSGWPGGCDECSPADWIEARPERRAMISSQARSTADLLSLSPYCVSAMIRPSRPLALLLLAFALASCARQTAQYPTQDVAVDAASAAALVSQYRLSKGLKPVSLDPALSRLALDQARAVAAIGDLSHDVSGSFSAVSRRRRPAVARRRRT